MSFRELLLLAAGALMTIVSSCSGGAGEEDSWRELLAESDRLASLDIMTWRDAQGWGNYSVSLLLILTKQKI